MVYGFCGASPTDLSKAFACLPHPLLIEKNLAYGFDTLLQNT